MCPCFAFLLRFDHTHGIAVDVEQVVGRAVARLQRELADGNAAGGVNVDGFGVLHAPARQMECFVDDKKYLDVKDDTFAKAGKVGLWTKADAQTSFDKVQVKNLGK